MIRKGKITLTSLLEHVGDLEVYVREAVLAIYKELFVPIRMNNEREFIESFSCKETILVSLRVKEDYKRIVGYAH